MSTGTLYQLRRSGLMRLRGDLHKIDLVIAQMGLENMQRLGLALHMILISLFEW